jgi:hypothetical protein
MGVDERGQSERFWSITGYTPEVVELLRNDLDKYVVSYTSGQLHVGPDALRSYGPEQRGANNTCVPPAVVRQP